MITVTPGETPIPPWAGLKFTCKGCGGVFLLESADDVRLTTRNRIVTPCCPTEGCMQQSVVAMNKEAA